MKNYKKYLTIFILSISVCLGIFTINNPITHADSFPHYIISKKWQMQSDGSQGGYSLKTKFNDNNIHTNNKNDSNPNDKIVIFNWQFKSLKKANHNTYYGKALESEYAKGTKPFKEETDFKIRLISNDTIWLIRKHVPHTNGNYDGNNNFGAIVFKKYQ